MSNSKETYAAILSENLRTVGKTINTVLVLQTSLSCIVIMLAYEVVSLDQKISLLGINLQAPIWVVLIGASVLLEVTYMYIYLLGNYEERMKEKLRQILLELGLPKINLGKVSYDSPLFYPHMFNLFEPPQETDRTIRVVNNLVASVLIGVTAFILPLGAQLAAAVKVIGLLGTKYWVLLLYAVIALFSLLSILDGVFGEKR